jgi:hypothetical protein
MKLQPCRERIDTAAWRAFASPESGLFFAPENLEKWQSDQHITAIHFALYATPVSCQTKTNRSDSFSISLQGAADG